jgi:hypothetical protein
MGSLNTYFVVRSLYECIDPANDIYKFRLECPMSPSRMLINLAACFTTLSMLTFKIARTLQAIDCFANAPVSVGACAPCSWARWADLELIKLEFENHQRLEAERVQARAVFRSWQNGFSDRVFRGS